MALATTCPQCKTSFKVVPDQLKLRRGLVRCGVCQFVFSGVEHLRYVDKDDDADPTTIQHAPDTTTGPSTAPGTPEEPRTPESRYNDVAAGLTFSDTHPGSGPLDSDTTDPVTQTLIAASEQGNTETAATPSAQVDEDGAVAQPWPSLTMPSTGTDTGTEEAPGTSRSTGTKGTAARATGKEGKTDRAAAAQPTPAPHGAPASSSETTATTTGTHTSPATGTGTGTGTGTEDTRGTDTATSQAEDTVDDGTASPASAPVPHATGAGDAPEAATAADGSSTDSADTADSSHTPDAGDTEGSEDAAGSGDTPDSEDTEDTAATEGTTPSGSGTSGSSKGRNRSRKDKDRSARGQSRWSRFMKGRSPAPEPASGPAPEPASGPAPEAAPAVATRPDAQEDDTSLNTVFFMADNEAPLPGHEHDRNVQLPASLRSDRSGHSQPPADSDLDPDTQATSALVDEANRIWRQHRPRHAKNADDDQAHDHAARTTHDAPEGATSRSSSSSSSSGSSRESSRSRRSRDGSSRRSRRRSSSHARESLGSLHDGYTHESAESAGWFTPKRRRIVMAVLGVLAAVQLVAVYRTEISYTVPFLRPVVQAISLLTGQTIQPPMNLSALSIESFELRNTQKTGQTRMTAILRNRSGTATRWPAMELTLTGPSNAILVRKVLLPAQYLPAGHDQAAGMAPNSEQPLDLMLDTSDLNLAGYSVSLFYP